MIPEIDEALSRLLRSEAVPGDGVDVEFDPPTREWAAARNRPTVDAYLYDIHEDIPRREYGVASVRDAAGIVTQRQRPVRWFRLSYLITCWTRRTEDEHRLLASVLGCLLATDALPLTGSGLLATFGAPVQMTIAEPAEGTRATADLWSSLGGNLKPSLDVVVIAPFPLVSGEPVAPPVTEATGVLARRTDVPGPQDPLRLRRVSRTAR